MKSSFALVYGRERLTQPSDSTVWSSAAVQVQAEWVVIWKPCWMSGKGKTLLLSRKRCYLTILNSPLKIFIWLFNLWERESRESQNITLDTYIARDQVQSTSYWRVQHLIIHCTTCRLPMGDWNKMSWAQLWGCRDEQGLLGLGLGSNSNRVYFVKIVQVPQL